MNDSDETRVLVNRLRVHGRGLSEHDRYSDADPSGLTNADAVSYGALLLEAATALAAAPTTPAPSIGVERIARIIDPDEWALHDLGMSKDPPVPAQFIGKSLNKATTILALTTPAPAQPSEDGS